MKLDIDIIKKGNVNTLDLDYSLDINTIEYYGDIINLISPVNVNGKVYVIDNKLYLNLRVKTQLQVSCSRCLVSFQYPFESSVNVELVHENLFDSQTDEVDEDIIYYQKNIIELDDLIKEHIVMNIPMKFICDESCKGLCSSCGAKIENGSCDCINNNQSENEYIDPRLAKLKDLFK